MFMKTKPTAEDKQEWYSPGAWRNADIPSQHRQLAVTYRGPRQPLASHHSGLASAGVVAAGTAISGIALFWLIYVGFKIIMLPTFLVNLYYLISALNTPHGMDHFNPTWLIISGLVVLFG